MVTASYREFQFSWLLFGILVPLQLFLTLVYTYQWGPDPMQWQTYLVATAANLLVLLLFYGMRTTVEDGKIKASFGIGLVSKKIHLSRVKDVATVETPWYYGYGIRWIPNGWLYNVRGPHAVELRFADTSRVIRIGTRNPMQLKRELQRAIHGSH